MNSNDTRTSPHTELNRESMMDRLRRKVGVWPIVDWNSPQDTQYAHRDERFEGVVHIFHRQWLGIRAAAGSLPGNKLAIDAHRALGSPGVEQVLKLLRHAGVSHYVFHGMSDNASTLIRSLSRLGLAEQTFLVYHGNVSQWFDSPERKLAFQAIQLAQEGHVRSLHILKPRHALPGVKSFAPMLLNMSPALGIRTPAPQSRKSTVLIPGTHEWRKNLHCNALGAAMLESVEQVVHYAPGLTLPEPWQGKLSYKPFVSREGTFDLMEGSLATLNVSLSECHPMVAIESEAVGTPCLRCRLFLDALEDHPYVRVVEVEDPTNPFAIREVLQQLQAVPQLELAEMMSDYSRAVDALSLSRYLAFLEL